MVSGRVVATTSSVAPADASANDEQLAATTVRPVLPRYVLRGISSAGFGRTIPVLASTIVGRAPDCGIRLDLPGLSRHHARVTPTDQGLLIEDLGSTNGWLLNEAKQQRAWARHGDELGGPGELHLGEAVGAVLLRRDRLDRRLAQLARQRVGRGRVDVDSGRRYAVDLLRNESRHRTMREAAIENAHRYAADSIVPMYEKLYEQVRA